MIKRILLYSAVSYLMIFGSALSNAHMLKKYEDACWNARTDAELGVALSELQKQRKLNAENKRIAFDYMQIEIKHEKLSRKDGWTVSVKNTGKNNFVGNLKITVESYSKETLIDKNYKTSIPASKSRKSRINIKGELPHRYHIKAVLTQPEEKGCIIADDYSILDCLAGPRQWTNLSGKNWKYTFSNNNNLPSTLKNGKEITVPHNLEKFKNTTKPYLWYGRSFAIPKSFSGKKIYLSLNGAAFNPEVYINGKLAGKGCEGYLKEEFDITSLVNEQGKNDLKICVGNKQTIQIPYDGKRAFIQPAGFKAQSTGLWQDVILVARPVVCVKDFFIQPSFRNKTLTVDTWLENKSQENVTANINQIINDDSQTLWDSAESTVNIPAGQTTKITFTKNWDNAKPWFPETPNLYVLNTLLEINGKTIDSSLQRFGFRETWVEGNKIYLNGIPAWLRRESCMMRWKEQGSGIGNYIRDMLARGTNTVRFHIDPAPEFFYDVCDEEGIMTIAEGAVYTDAPSYAVRNDELWNNIARHLQTLAKMCRNHPSLIMYCPENEFIFCFGGGEPYSKIFPEKLPFIGEELSKTDPTKPLSYDAEGDVVGTCETFNIHYPDDWTKMRILPNGGFRKPVQTDKPLIIGEYLCSSFLKKESFRESSGDWVLRPEIKGGQKPWKQAYIYSTARMYTEAYRMSGIAGLNPWVFGEGLDCLMPPVLFSAKNLPRTYISNSRQTFDMMLLNDTFVAKELTPSIALIRERNGFIKSEQHIKLQAGERQSNLHMVLEIPAVEEPSKCILCLTVSDKTGKEIFRQEHSASIIPEPKVDASEKSIAVYSIADTPKLFKDISGIKKISSTTSISPEFDLIIIAGKIRKNDIPKLKRYASDGGKLFVVEPETAMQLASEAIQFRTSAKATFGFITAPKHPLVKNLDNHDFCWWAPDNFIFDDGAFIKSQSANVKTIVQGGLGSAALFEWRTGKGCMIFNAFPLIKKADLPIVKQLLKNIIAYADHDLPTPKAVYIVGSIPENTSTRLRGFGVTIVPRPVKNCVLLIDGSYCPDKNEKSLIDSFLETGGTVWIHRLIPAAVKSFKNYFDSLHLEEIKENTDLKFATVPAYQAVPVGTPDILAGTGLNELTWFKSKNKIANYHITNVESCGGQILTRPAVLAQWNKGNGRIIVDQVNWVNPGQEELEKVNVYLTTFLGNMGISHNAERLYLPSFFYSNLTMEKKLSSDIAADTEAKLHKLLSTGKSFNNIPFRLVGNEKSAACVTDDLKLSFVPKTNKTAEKMYLLAASMQNHKKETTIATVKVTFADGSVFNKKIIMGAETDYLYRPRVAKAVEDKNKPTDCKQVWQGEGDTSNSPSLFMHELNLPVSHTDISNITIQSSNKEKLLVAGATLAKSTLGTKVLVAEASLIRNKKSEKPDEKHTFKKGDILSWKMKGMLPGKYHLSLYCRTGSGKDSPGGLLKNYRLKLNGHILPLSVSGLPFENKGGASDGSWHLWWGYICTREPVFLNAGDNLTLEANDWSMAKEISLNLMARDEETRKRDMPSISGTPMLGQLVLNLLPQKNNNN